MSFRVLNRIVDAFTIDLGIHHTAFMDYTCFNKKLALGWVRPGDFEIFVTAGTLCGGDTFR